jgi:hypothetical protein
LAISPLTDHSIFAAHSCLANEARDRMSEPEELPDINRLEDPGVSFEHGVDVYLMAIDGTWRRGCVMQEASDSGAKLLVRGPIEGLNLKEFFLLLSSTGLAYRRCELSWVNGEQIGAKFTKGIGKKK